MRRTIFGISTERLIWAAQKRGLITVKIADLPELEEL